MKLRLVLTNDGITNVCCGITDTLDKLVGSQRKHYQYFIVLNKQAQQTHTSIIQAAYMCINTGTVGTVFLDKNDKITDIQMNNLSFLTRLIGKITKTEYARKSYMSDIENILREKYIGVIIESRRPNWYNFPDTE